MRSMALIDALMSLACCSAGIVVQAAASGPARYCNWELGTAAACGRQLRGQPEEKNGDGYCCGKHPAAIRVRVARAAKAAAASAAVPAASALLLLGPAPKQTRKRRAESDPGEQQSRARPLTRRITPPKPVPTQKRQRTTRCDEEIMRLLDETHARRMTAHPPAALM